MNYANNITIYYSDGKGFKQGPNALVNKQAAIIFGDMNGDKQIEGIYYLENQAIGNSSTYFGIISFSNSNPNQLPLQYMLPHYTEPNYSQYKNFRLIDFDGDGKQEIMAEKTGYGTSVIQLVQNNNILNASPKIILTIGALSLLVKTTPLFSTDLIFPGSSYLIAEYLFFE